MQPDDPSYQAVRQILRERGEQMPAGEVEIDLQGLTTRSMVGKAVRSLARRYRKWQVAPGPVREFPAINAQRWGPVELRFSGHAAASVSQTGARRLAKQCADTIEKQQAAARGAARRPM